MGGLYVDPVVFPYVFRRNDSNGDGVWPWFLPSDDGILWYYNFSTGTWEKH
tara:strand:- start:317 stop:469 length:153 start_codon:yes stop_codon:yes gene_type:complete